MIRLSRVVAVIVVSLLVLPGTVSGKMDGPLARKSLQGLSGVHLYIPPLDPLFKNSGLSESRIRTDVELKLRLAGLNVLTEIERSYAPGQPQLSVYLLALKQPKGLYVYHVSIS